MFLFCHWFIPIVDLVCVKQKKTTPSRYPFICRLGVTVGVENIPTFSGFSWGFGCGNQTQSLQPRQPLSLSTFFCMCLNERVPFCSQRVCAGSRRIATPSIWSPDTAPSPAAFVVAPVGWLGAAGRWDCLVLSVAAPGTRHRQPPRGDARDALLCGVTAVGGPPPVAVAPSNPGYCGRRARWSSPR